MSTSLFIILTGVAIASVAISVAISAVRRGRWLAAAIVATLTITGLRLGAGAIAATASFSSDSLAVELAAIVTLIFVPLIAVQYVREALTARPEPAPRTFRDYNGEAEVVPAEGSRPRVAESGDHDGRSVRERTPEARLREAQSHFRDFADSSRTGMWVQNARDNELIYVSPAFERTWGVDAETLYRSPEARIAAVHPEDRVRVRSALAQAVNGREVNEEYRVQRPDGTVRWIWDRAVPVRDASGTILRVAGMAEDITQRKGVEEVNLFRANFVANMSHEVRTPLNIMIGYLEFLLDGTFGELSQQQREITERVRKNAEELLDLMSASLDLSRLDDRTIPLAIDAIDVGDLAREVVGDIGKLLGDGEVAMRSEIDVDLPSVCSDRQKIKMILKNLLSNAVKFTAAGEILVTARSLADGVELSVRDTGTGIPADALPRVFEPFRQGANGSGDKSGVGLGLFIVRRLVDILEGQITVESAVGQGTTVRVWLPRSLSPEREEGSDDNGNAELYVI